MTEQPRSIGEMLQQRVQALRQIAPAHHATDPEPPGRVRDVGAWWEANWRRAIPARFREARLADVAAVHGDQVAADLAAWVQHPGPRPNLLLFGAVGVGKTHAAVAALRPIHEQRATVAVWPVTTLLEATSPGAPHSRDALASAIDADVLLLDDLGMERSTEWAAERIYEVVNQRWQDAAPTVITTNIPPEQMADAVGERVWSRLVHGAVAIRLGGPDRRRTTP